MLKRFRIVLGCVDERVAAVSDLLNMGVARVFRHFLGKPDPLPSGIDSRWSRAKLSQARYAHSSSRVPSHGGSPIGDPPNGDPPQPATTSPLNTRAGHI